jgi:cupin 2 domain-containing protein
MSRRPPAPMNTSNLFDDCSPPSAGERFDVLLTHKNLVVERIVSSANITSKKYVQSQDEWVVLVRGEAEIEVAGEAVVLKSGDHLFLPSGTVHIVKSASEGAVWLAVHLHAV